MENIATVDYIVLDDAMLEEVGGGSLTLAVGSVVLVGWKAGLAYGAIAGTGAAIFGAGVYNGYRGY